MHGKYPKHSRRRDGPANTGKCGNGRRFAGGGSVEAGVLSGDANAENTGTAGENAGDGTGDVMPYSGREPDAQDAKDLIYDFKDNKTTGSVVVEKHW